MVEGGSLEISESEMLEALKVAQRGIRDVIKIEQQLIGKAGPAKKFEDQAAGRPDPGGAGAGGRRIADGAGHQCQDKSGRSNAIKAVKEQVLEKLTPEFAEQARAGEPSWMTSNTG